MTAAAEADSLLTRTLDQKYRLRRLIGRGGMGAVYEAEHVGTGRTVAVKTILPDLLASTEAVERFRREARAAGRLRHPNIVDVTDFGIDHGGEIDVAYLVMEYLEGMTLRDLIKARGALPIDVTLEIVEQIALALQVAHAVGIVHRDLKPDNVWLVPDPRGGYFVRVLDFGIAKLRDSAAVDVDRPGTPGAAHVRFDDDFSRADTLAKSDTPTMRLQERSAESHPDDPTAPLTLAGATLGTPAYMSPEQCRAGYVDHRSDIYSLGIVAYEALSGRVPFTGRLIEIIDAHLRQIPQRLDREGRVSSRVADVVARALEKAPADRHPSARAMAGSLYAAAEGPSVIVRRAAALYLDRFSSFLRLSMRAGLPTLVLIAVLMIVTAFAPRIGVPLLVFASVFGWTVVTLLTNAAFALAIDELRKRPLEAIDVSAVFSELRRRLGVRSDAFAGRLFAALAVYYVRAELKSRVGAGDLAFLIAFLEGRSFSEAAERCDVLAKSSKRSYDWIRALIFVGLFVPPLIEACVIYSIAALLSLPRPERLAVLGAVALIPLNAVFINPVFSSALALVYFRARQANGEDVALSSVLAGRL